MEVIRPFISIVGIFVVLQLSVCSLPSDTEPARWKMHLEVPVADQKYMLRDIISGDDLPGVKVIYNDSLPAGDTITVTRSGTVNTVIEKKLGSIDTSHIKKKLGPLTLKNIPEIRETFLLGKGVTGGHVVDVPLPIDVRFSLKKEKKVKGLKWITFDEKSPPLELRIENRSGCAALKDIRIALLNMDKPVAEITTSQIPLHSETNVMIPLAGKCMQFPLTIEVAATIPAGMLIRQEDAVSVSFSFNQQVVSEAVLNDSFVRYQQTYSDKIKIADSLRLASIDLDTTLLYCEIYCPSLAKVSVGGMLDNAWESEYSINNDLQTVEDLHAGLDSTQFAGRMQTDTIFKNGEQDHYRINKRIQPIRIFPIWDNITNMCHISYTLSMASIPENKLMHFSKNDSVTITVIVLDFPFTRIHAFLMKATDVFYATDMKSGFDWKPAITDPLKQMFRFRNAQLHLKLTPDLPFGSRIDSLQVAITMKEKKYLQDSAELEKTFYALSSDERRTVEMNITNVFNNWPDTVTFDTRFTLPSHTGVILENSDAEDLLFTSSLAIGMTLDWSVLVPLCWEVVDTVHLELDTTRFYLNRDQVEIIHKLQEPKITIDLDIENNTNIGFVLHAVGACGKYKDKLMAFPDSLAGKVTNDYINENELFSLFDENGLTVNPRGAKSTSVLQMNTRVIEALASEDRCLLRWFVTIPSVETDALHTDDYFTIKAKGVIEGVGSVTSL